MQIPYIKDGKIKKQPVDFSYFNATEKPLEILAIHFPNELKSGSFPFVGEELVSEHLNMAAFLSKLHEKKLSFHSISNISNMSKIFHYSLLCTYFFKEFLLPMALRH